MNWQQEEKKTGVGEVLSMLCKKDFLILLLMVAYAVCCGINTRVIAVLLLLLLRFLECKCGDHGAYEL